MGAIEINPIAANIFESGHSNLLILYKLFTAVAISFVLISLNSERARFISQKSTIICIAVLSLVQVWNIFNLVLIF